MFYMGHYVSRITIYLGSIDKVYVILMHFSNFISIILAHFQPLWKAARDGGASYNRLLELTCRGQTGNIVYWCD